MIAREVAALSRASGCSPYDLVRLLEERPDVYEEYTERVISEREASDRAARDAARARRVNRIFGGRNGR